MHRLRRWPNIKPISRNESWEEFIFHGAAFFGVAVANHNIQKSHVSQKKPPCIISIPNNRIFTRRAVFGWASYAKFCTAAQLGAARRGAARRVVWRDRSLNLGWWLRCDFVEELGVHWQRETLLQCPFVWYFCNSWSSPLLCWFYW